MEQENLYLKAQVATLFDRIHVQDRLIAEPKEQIAIRDARILELERRLRLNSTNSSKPLVKRRGMKWFSSFAALSTLFDQAVSRNS